MEFYLNLKLLYKINLYIKKNLSFYFPMFLIYYIKFVNYSQIIVYKFFY